MHPCIHIGTLVFASLLATRVAAAAVRLCVTAVAQTVRSKLLDGSGRHLDDARDDAPHPQPVTPPWARATESHARARAPRCELAHAPRWVHPPRSAKVRPPPCTARRRGVPEGFRVPEGSGQVGQRTPAGSGRRRRKGRHRAERVGAEGRRRRRCRRSRRAERGAAESTAEGVSGGGGCRRERTWGAAESTAEGVSGGGGRRRERTTEGVTTKRSGGCRRVGRRAGNGSSAPAARRRAETPRRRAESDEPSSGGRRRPWL